MHFPGRKTYVLVVEKVHFQESDVFLNVGIVERRLIQSDRRLIQTGPQTYSGNHQFGVGIRGVSENVPGAAAFCIIFACETLGIRAFLSSPTWNLIGKSINPIILVRSKKMGSTALSDHYILLCCTGTGRVPKLDKNNGAPWGAPIFLSNSEGRQLNLI